MNNVRPDMTYSKELEQKMMLEKLILETFELNNFSQVLCRG